MKSYFFTIVIPVREINEYLLHETLPSLTNLNYKDFETIIVPDTVSAYDEELTNTYSWLRIIPAEGPPGIKRDIGASYAKGEILSFVDDDVILPPDWLTNAANIFAKYNPKILCGPGILPPFASTLEHIFDTALSSPVGSGGYTYRFTKQSSRMVEDFPAMNLMIQKSIFDEVGGFQTPVWPGEDSKLLHRLYLLTKERSLYHPDVWIYHHRKATIKGYIAQHIRYGTMRGTFAFENDENSQRLIYYLPAAFVMYLSVLLLVNLFSQPILWLYIPLWLYCIMLNLAYLHLIWIKRPFIAALGAIVVIPLTHILYGVFFIKSYLTMAFQNLKSNISARKVAPSETV
ncbi:MAG: glycosyltransferase family 2 protein [Weeksellaceae bacterium]